MLSQLPAARFSRLPALLALILGGHFLVHFGLGWMLGLSGDEAHYALYAANPALSYFDHPPMVGWIQWPLVALDAPAGLLRLIPEALWLISALLVYGIAQRLPARLSPAGGTAHAAGLWAVVVFSLAPVLHVLGIGLLPDTLLMTLTAAILWQTLRMMDAIVVRQARAWLLLGALLGLAGLSKYTAIFAALPVVVCLAAAHGWRLFLRPGPWMALLLAMALVSPVLVWNAQHGWISFVYQLKHGAGSHWQLTQVGVFMLAQVLLYGPLLLWGAIGVRRSRVAGHDAGPRASPRWLLSFFAVPFLVLAYLSGGGSGLPHWTAPAWVALTPFAGVGLAVAWAEGRRVLIGILLAVQAGICLLLYALMLMAGPPWISGGTQPEPINPFTDFYGWDVAGEKAKQLTRTHQLKHLAVQNWTLASRLAWYARPLPVHVLAPGFDQFSLWSGELAPGTSALLMDWSQMAYQLPVGEGRFQSCTPLDTFAVVRAGRPVASFTFHHCTGWGGHPAPKRVGEP